MQCLLVIGRNTPITETQADYLRVKWPHIFTDKYLRRYAGTNNYELALRAAVIGFKNLLELREFLEAFGSCELNWGSSPEGEKRLNIIVRNFTPQIRVLPRGQAPTSAPCSH